MRLIPLVLMLAPAVARAQAEGPQSVHVTTFLLEHPGVDEARAAPVLRAIADGLKRNPRLEMKDLETRLAEFAQEVPQEQIDQARLLLSEGQKALTALELGAAVKKLTLAVEALARVLPHIKKQELADAMMTLAAAHFENGDPKSAHAELVRLFTWRADYHLDTNRFPPDLIAPVEDARKEVERAKRGSLEIHSEPPAAQAYVDGQYVGVTPTFAEGLVVGQHWITLKREGYRKAVKPGEVSARQQERVSFSLERSGKYLLVQQALDAIEKSLGRPVLDTNSDNLKEVLFVDHAVFVRVSPASGPDRLNVNALLYDLRTRHRLTQVTRTVAVSNLERELAGVTAALYLNVRYEAELEAPKDAPIPKRHVRAPFYKTWWFWTASAVVVSGVIAAAVAVPRPKVCGDGNWCGSFSF